MDARRRDLAMTWAEVAREAKITVETLRAVRRGNNVPSPLTARGLDRALRWRPGSVEEILAGGGPAVIGTAATHDEPDLTPDEAELVERIRRDPRKRRRLLDAILAGTGQDHRSTEPDSDEQAGHKAS